MLRFIYHTAVLWLMLVLSPAVSSFAQQSFFYNVKACGDGAVFNPHQSISAITEDKKGLLWIGTDNGLYNYDGKFFTAYTQQAQAAEALPSNMVRYNYQDRSGRYWVYVYRKGLYNFSPTAGTFSRFVSANEQQFNIHAYELALPFEDSKGQLWLAAQGFGIVRYDRNTNQLVPYKICQQGNCGGYRSASWVNKMIEDPLDGSFWLCTNGGLVHFFPATGNYEIINDHYFSDIYTGEAATVISICLDLHNNIWLGTWSQGLKKYDRATRQFTHFLPSPGTLDGTRNICDGVALRDSNSLWVSSLDAGLLVFNITTGQFGQVVPLNSWQPIAHSSGLMQGANGSLWFCAGKQLLRLTPATDLFSFYPFAKTGDANMDLGYPANYLLLGQQLYIGTYYNGAFFAYNLHNGKTQRYALPNGQQKYDVNGMAKDAWARIWLATSQGVFVYDTLKKQLAPLPVSKEQAAMLNRWTTAIAFDGPNRAWIATASGLVSYDLITHKATLYSKEVNGTGLPTNDILTVFCDAAHNVWVGTRGQGLGCLPADGRSFVFFNNNRNKNYPTGNCVSIAQNKQGHILYAVRGEGLLRLQQAFTAGERVDKLNQLAALPSDYVKGVLVDTQDRTWVYSAAGIAVMDSSAHLMAHFSEKEGLAESDFESVPYMDMQGNLYVGGNKGFQVLNSQRLLEPVAIPTAIHFSEFHINGKPYAQQSGNNDSNYHIVLHPTENNIDLQFAAFATDYAELLRYRYRLKGYDPDWVSNGRNHITYTNLPPGDYELHINTGRFNGNWATKDFVLFITILKPWYQQLWFIILCCLAGLALLYALYRLRIGSIKEKLRLKADYDKKLAEIEMRALRAQMNPHFIFNCLSSINRYIVKSDEKTASNYLTKFSKLIRQILDNSIAETIALEKELETLRLYIDMEVLRFNHVFDYTIIVNPEVPLSSINIPPMLVQPYVENAIWHGLLHKEDGRGLLEVKLSMQNEHLLTIAIQDNGVGREKAALLKSKDVLKTKSYGMQITSDRLKLMNNLYNMAATVTITDLYHPNGTAAGTQVVVALPV